MSNHEQDSPKSEVIPFLSDEQKKKFYEGLMAALLLLTALTSIMVTSSRDKYQDNSVSTTSEDSK